MKTKAALYARVSLKDGRQDVENQLRPLREYAEREGLQVVKEYVDHGTGGNGSRDQFRAMFDAAANRRFSLLLFFSLDRLSREGTLQTLQYLQRLTACGVGYKSLTETYLDSMGPFSDVVISLLSCIARQERLRVGERTIAGLMRVRAEGRVLGRPKVVPNANRVIELRKQGMTLTAIAAELAISESSVYRALRCTQQTSSSIEA
jgi:DNA invertase Pin-like site-specific DNA recombinase